MSDTLRELFADYAAQARPYDVRAGALASARRRRAARRAAPYAALVMVIAVAGLVQWQLRPFGGDQNLPVVPKRISISGFPAIIGPAVQAPPLPEQGGVDRAALVYRSGTQAAYLVTANGSQYRLDATLPTATSFDLSPDRRWLVYQLPGGPPVTTRLRDLTGSDSVGFEFPNFAIGWSPDGRWLALGSGDPEKPGVVRVVDLRKPGDPGIMVDLSSFARQAVTSILANGDLVLAPIDGDGNLNLSIIDSHTATMKRTIKVDLSAFQIDGQPQPDGSVGRTGVMISWRHLVFTTDGLMAVQMFVRGKGTDQRGFVYDPGDILVIDLNTEQVRDRWAIPYRPGSPGESSCKVECWNLLEMLPEGPLLEHRTERGAISWDLYRPQTGELLVVMEIDNITVNQGK